MDPDIYNNHKHFNDAIEKPDKQELLIEKFNHRMTQDVFDDFLRIKFD